MSSVRVCLPAVLAVPLARFTAAAVLIVSAAACDSSGPEGPGALLTVSAETADGAPAAGLDLFATYGQLIQSEARSPGGAFDVSPVYPNPTVRASRVDFEVSQSGPVLVRVFDLAGVEQAVVFDAPMSAGRSTVLIDADGWPGGAYRVAVEVGGERVDRILLKTDAEDGESEGGLALFLGRTDSDGRVVVTDSTRFPGLFDIPTRAIVHDDTGFALGEFQIGRSFGLELQDAQGTTRGVAQATLVAEGTSVSITTTP